MNHFTLRSRMITLILLLSLSVAACQPLAISPAAVSVNQHLSKLVGSWQVETTVVKQAATFPALLTFTSDGIVITDEPPSPFETSGHGNWVATGPDTADFTFLALIGSAEGPLSSTIKVVGSVNYDSNADTWAGPFTVQVVDAEGTELLADQGTFTGVRIAIEKPAPTAQSLKPGDKIGEMHVVQGPEPFDLNITHYGAYCNANPMLELNSTEAKPGNYTVECAVPPLPKMFIAFGLTARSAELLDDVWSASASELYLNDQAVDQTAFGALEADVPVTGMPGQSANEVLILKARVWNVILENLTPGQFTMRLVWHVSRQTFDGDVTLPAGDYDINYKITVDPAMALPEGVPAPVALVKPLVSGDKIGEMRVVKGPDPFDLNIPPIPAFCNTNPFFAADAKVATPGVYTVECAMPPLPQLLVGFGWVAINPERRDLEWSAVTSELYINQQAVDQSQFGTLDADVPVTGVPGMAASEVVTQSLRAWNVLLENLQPGPMTLRWVFQVNQELNDGVVTVPAGTYDTIFKITVDESLANAPAQPKPVVLIQQTKDVFDAFNAAVNAHDVDNALSFFAADAIAQFPNQPPPNVYTGSAEIRTWLESDVKNNIHVEIENAKTSGDMVSATGKVDVDSLPPDLVLVGTVEVTVKDGKITSFSYMLDDETLAKLAALEAK